MDILVCMKQVPATSKVNVNPETGSLLRSGTEAKTNPYDLSALETALRIREKSGGKVTVLTMGPPQAEQMIRDAYRMGADDAVLLSTGNLPDPTCWQPPMLFPRESVCWETSI